MTENIYITTSIPYINADLHIGHSLEFVQADFLARFYRLKGKNVFLSTGSDENSLKVVKGARDKNFQVKEFVDLKVKSFLELLDFLNISYNNFQRTSSPNHKKAVEEIFLRIKNDTYQKKYQGLYCQECEAFLKENELKNGLCPIHKTKPILIKEKNYFFKQTKYKRELLDVVTKDKLLIVPVKRKKSILNWLKNIEDANISRSKSRAGSWGIEIPGNRDQVFYVWFDALINYLSSLGFPEQSQNFNKFWLSDKAEIIHIIGKDIARFHTVLWPAMLISAKIKLPTKIFIHGFVLLDGEKMSKSRGNFISPIKLKNEYTADTLRYFLLREIPPYEDGNFSLKRLKARYNDDLAKELGNLSSRTISLLLKNNPIKIEKNQLHQEAENLRKSFSEASLSFKFNKAVESLWTFMKEVDKYINQKKPWQKDKKNKDEVFSTLWLSLKEISFWLEPIMPKTSEKIKGSLSFTNKSKIIKVKPIVNLFPKK